MDNDDGDRFVVKLRGLPWNSTTKDVLDFLQNVEVVDGEKGVHMAVGRDGRANGEAYVECASANDLDTAFGYNKNMIGHRYIEIFNAKPDEFENVVRRLSNSTQDTFVRLRGLPFSCKPEDIEQFFSGLEIKNGKTGIFIVYDSNGRMSGEAFVQFRSVGEDGAEGALKRNREKIGHRYIEIFRSSSAEARRATLFGGNDRGGNDRGGGGGGNMRGGGGFGGNDRGMRGGRGNRGNFRDRPYPDWSGGNNNSNSNDSPGGWRRGNNNNNNPGNFGGNNFSNDNFGSGPRNGPLGGGNKNFGNDNFGDNLSRNAENMLKMTNNLLLDFERNWKSGSNSNSSSNFNNRGDDDGPPPRGNFGNDRGFGGNNNFGGNNSGGGFFNRNNNNNSDDDGPPPPRGNFGNDRGNFGGMNCGPPGGGNMGNNGPFLVHMRGMPYDCAEMEIHQFFAPLKLVGCDVIFNNGRHTGEADAFFGSVADAQEAMKKHKEKMGSRYIELFANRNNERRGRF